MQAVSLQDGVLFPVTQNPADDDDWVQNSLLSNNVCEVESQSN